MKGSYNLKSSSSRLSLIYGCTLTVLSSTTGIAQAQTAAPSTTEAASVSAPAETANNLGDIVVTATRRSEAVSRVPISVAAYSQERLDRLGVRNINDIAKMTPGVSFRGNNPSGGVTIDIRGINSIVGAATTGVYIDDTPIQSRATGLFSSNPFPVVFDLERVEILRGPQGTLFGAGSEGGTVRFITPQPSLTDTSIYGRAEVSTTKQGSESYEIGTAVGIPLIEGKLGARISGYYRHDGGWIDRVNFFTGAGFKKDANDKDSYAVKAAVTWQPVEDLEITPSIFYQKERRGTTDFYWGNISNVSSENFRSGDPLGSPGRDRFLLPSLKVTYNLGSVDIVSNTSYFRRDLNIRSDFSAVQFAGFTGPFLAPFGVDGLRFYGNQTIKQRNFTQEVRLQSADPDARLSWVLGAYYGHQKMFSNELAGGFDPNSVAGAWAFYLANGINFLGPDPTPFLLQPGNGEFSLTDTDKERQLAGFLDISYKITPELKLQAGVRVARVKTESAHAAEGPLSFPGTSSSSISATPITPKFSINYQPDQNNLVYASAAKGYRNGGGNGSLPPTCSASLASVGLTAPPPTYKSDSLWSYEVGSKNKLFGGKLQLDGSAYYIDWKNIQSFVLLPCQFAFTGNTGRLVSKGFDLQVRYRPASTLTLGLSVGYNNADFKENAYAGPVQAPPRVVSKGNSIGNAPWTISLNSEFQFNLLDTRDGYFTTDWVYRSKNKDVTAAQDPLTVAYDPLLPRISKYSVLNIQLGIRHDSLDVALFANNLLNDHPITYAFHDTPFSPLDRIAGARPRTVGIRATFRQ